MIRAKMFYGCLSLLLFPLAVLAGISQLYRGANLLVLSILIILSLMLVFLMGRDIWSLRVRILPLWADIAISVIALGSFAALIAIREAGIMVWNLSYLAIPITLVAISIALVSAITEYKKHVRVYFGMRSFSFRPNEPHR